MRGCAGLPGPGAEPACRRRPASADTPPIAPAAPPAGDGAGMLCAMPDSFFSAVLMDEQSFRLPPLGEYAVGMVFLPTDEGQRNTAKCVMERVAAKLGHDSFTWRTVPTDNASLGASAVAVEPRVEQWFISARGIKEQLDTEQQVRRPAGTCLARGSGG